MTAVYQISVYVPDADREAVKAAMFAAGGGRIGDYDQCCWQVRGTGQFRPLPGADPHIGTVGAVEQVEEWRLELVVADDCVAAVIAAMKAAHPYEEPAYAVIRLEQF